MCNSKNSKFMKKQEGCLLFIQSGITTPLSKLPLLGDILFQGVAKNNFHDD